jgi:hypothetical protein
MLKVTVTGITQLMQVVAVEQQGTPDPSCCHAHQLGTAVTTLYPHSL